MHDFPFESFSYLIHLRLYLLSFCYCQRRKKIEYPTQESITKRERERERDRERKAQRRCICVLLSDQSSGMESMWQQQLALTFFCCNGIPQVFLNGPTPPSFLFILSRKSIIIQFLKNTLMWKISIQYTVPGFEITTFKTRLSSFNHSTRAPQIYHLNWFAAVFRCFTEHALQNYKCNYFNITQFIMLHYNIMLHNYIAYLSRRR